MRTAWIRSLVVDFLDLSTLEHPCSHALLLVKKVQRTCQDQCQFGTPWRKRTAVLSSLVDTHALARVCTSQIVCSWSRRPHVWHGCVNVSGISMARLSSPLSEIICRCIARVLQDAYGAQQVAAMDQVLQSLSCFRKKNFSAGSFVPNGKRRWEDAFFKVGGTRWVVPCQSSPSFELSRHVCESLATGSAWSLVGCKVDHRHPSPPKRTCMMCIRLRTKSSSSQQKHSKESAVSSSTHVVTGLPTRWNYVTGEP